MTNKLLFYWFLILLGLNKIVYLRTVVGFFLFFFFFISINNKYNTCISYSSLFISIYCFNQGSCLNLMIVCTFSILIHDLVFVWNFAYVQRIFFAMLISYKFFDFFNFYSFPSDAFSTYSKPVTDKLFDITHPHKLCFLLESFMHVLFVFTYWLLAWEWYEIN